MTSSCQVVLETSFARAFVSDISYINGNVITKLKSNVAEMDDPFVKKLESLLAIFGHAT